MQQPRLSWWRACRLTQPGQLQHAGSHVLLTDQCRPAINPTCSVRRGPSPQTRTSRSREPKRAVETAAVETYRRREGQPAAATAAASRWPRQSGRHMRALPPPPGAPCTQPAGSPPRQTDHRRVRQRTAGREAEARRAEEEIQPHPLQLGRPGFEPSRQHRLPQFRERGQRGLEAAAACRPPGVSSAAAAPQRTCTGTSAEGWVGSAALPRTPRVSTARGPARAADQRWPTANPGGAAGRPPRAPP